MEYSSLLLHVYKETSKHPEAPEKWSENETLPDNQVQGQVGHCEKLWALCPDKTVIPPTQRSNPKGQSIFKIG